MSLRKPKNHTVVDMYKAWCKETLVTNKDYFGAYDPRLRMAGVQIIYQHTSPKMVTKEVPIGEINGKNNIFRTKSMPIHEHTGNRTWITVYKNGKKLVGFKYQYATDKGRIIMSEPPERGDKIEVDYGVEEYNIIMSYTKFRIIIEKYNKYASEAVIQGHRLSLGSNLGYLQAARVERSFEHMRCDIVATKKARKTDPTHPAIYYTDEDYCFIHWQKFFKITNETVYRFKPAKHTMAEDFYKAIASNPVLRTLYKYMPLKNFVPREDTQLQQSA